MLKSLKETISEEHIFSNGVLVPSLRFELSKYGICESFQNEHELS